MCLRKTCLENANKETLRIADNHTAFGEFFVKGIKKPLNFPKQ